MKRILFVNNESKLLSELKQILPRMQDRWEALFAGTCREALTHMERGAVDALVTDSRIPGLGGLSLLDTVTLRHPKTIRIVLREDSDGFAATPLAGPAHRCLPKSCGANGLCRALERTFALRQLLNTPALTRLVSGMEALPLLPEVYVALAAELRFGNPSIQRIGRIVAGDASLSGELLHLVNSAFFGRRAKATRPQQAVEFLGIQPVRALVLSLKIFEQYSKNDGMSLARVRALQEHSLQVALLARTIASVEQGDADRTDAAFLCGLLHDVGRLVLAANLPDAYAEWLRVVEGYTGHVSAESERAAFGTTHAETGAYMIGLWGFTDTVVEAVAYHHHPEFSGEETFGPLAAVHAADALLEHDRGGAPGQALDISYLCRIGAADRVETWRGLAAAQPCTGGDPDEETAARVTNRSRGRRASNPRPATGSANLPRRTSGIA